MSSAIIINPVAGRRKRAGSVGDRVDLARRVAAECGEPVDIHVTEEAGHARALAQAARDRGARLVVAWGGDGTINEVASALLNGAVPLAIVPAGSGNGLARELRISADPAAALASALRGRPQPLDAGEIEGRLFVNVAGVGLDAQIASDFNAASNRRRGLGGYVWLTGRALCRYPADEYDIVTPDARLRVRALFVTIANSAQFGNGVRIAPAARVDDGMLDLVVVEERSRLDSLCRLPRMLTGSSDRMATWSSRRIADVTVESRRPMRFHVDGEPFEGATRLHARVLPAALQICVGSQG